VAGVIGGSLRLPQAAGYRAPDAAARACKRTAAAAATLWVRLAPARR